MNWLIELLKENRVFFIIYYSLLILAFVSFFYCFLPKLGDF